MSAIYAGYMGLKEEAVFGEEPDAPEAFEEITGESILMRSEQISPQSANGLLVSRYSVPGRISAGGGIDTILSPEGAVPWMLKGVLGKATSSEAAPGAFDHVFSPLHSPRPPSYTIQTNIDEMSQAWLGCVFSGMTMTVLKNQLVGLTFSVLAQRPSESAAPSSPGFTGTIPFSGHAFEFTLNGIGNLKIERFTLNIRKNIETVFTLNRKRYCSKFHAGGLEISGSLTLEFETESERRRLWGALTATTPQNQVAPGSMSVSATHAKEAAPGCPFTFGVNLPELYYESAPANITHANNRVTQIIDFKPTWNQSAGEIITMTMRNSVASYPGAV